MRVICIDENYCSSDGTEPKFGEVVTVAGQSSVYPDCWDILEYPFSASGFSQTFFKTHFAILSSIDETEMIRETNLQKAQIN